MNKNIIILPEHNKDSWVLYGRWKQLFDNISKTCGFDIIYSDDIPLDIIEPYSKIMVFKSPTLITPTINSNLSNLANDKKLICYTTDIHYWDDVGGNYTESGKQQWLSAMNRMFDRADVILCPYKEFFMYKWGEYKDKFVWFPQFFNKEDYIDLGFNHNPICKCSFTSYHPGGYYPFRDFLLRDINDDIVRLDHPTYGKDIAPNSKVGRDFATFLNKYLCSVTSGSKLNYAVAKFFEIPAASSLLLGKGVGDLKELGFVDGTNYIAVDEKNIFDIITDVINNSGKYYTIRKTGQNFALTYHTELNRIEQFKEIVGSL